MSNLIYIIGSGRSGSTVIERVLNSAPDVMGVGEIHALWRLPIESLLCSCGERVPECAFWSEALEHAKIGPTELARLAELEATVVRNSYLIKLGYNMDKISTDPGISEFVALQERLFAGVRSAGKVDIALDSSKAGPRAWILAALKEKPLLLHSYRGAKDVISSWRRPKFEPSTNTPMKKPPIREAAIDWIKVERAARTLNKVVDLSRIDYKEFSESPKAALKAALEPSLPGLVDRINWTGTNRIQPSNFYHSVLGNPDRFNRDEIEIRPQHASDRSKFSIPERMLINSVGGALEIMFR